MDKLSIYFTTRSNVVFLLSIALMIPALINFRLIALKQKKDGKYDKVIYVLFALGLALLTALLLNNTNDN